MFPASSRTLRRNEICKDIFVQKYAMHRSFTLLEVIIATLILGIVALIGWGSMRAQLPRVRMVRAARSFKSDLMNIRSLAVHTNRETRLRLTRAGGDCSDGSSWGGAWEMAVGNRASASDRWDLLPEDSFDDGADDDQSEARVDLGGNADRAEKWVCLQQWDTLTGPVTDNQDAIVFSPRGWVSNPAGDFNDSGYIELTFVNQDGQRNSVSDTVTVLVSRAGSVRLVSRAHVAVDPAAETDAWGSDL